MTAISSSRTGYISGTTSGWAAKPLHGIGSTNLYAVVLDTSAVKIRVYKGTGDGTWTEQDSANAVSHSGALHSYSSGAPLTANGYIYVLYRTATSTLRVRRFDTTTDTWETSDVGSADAATTAHPDYGVSVDVRSDGDVIVAYRDNSGGAADTRIVHTRWEGTSWNAPTDSTGTSSDWNVQGSLISTTDQVIWFMFDNAASDESTQGLTAANGFVAGFAFDQDTSAGRLFAAHPGYVLDGATHRPGLASKDTTGELDFRIYGNLNPSGATVTNAVSDAGHDPGVAGAAVAVYNSLWYVVWSSGTAIYADGGTGTISAPTFGTDVSLVSGLGSDPIVYAVGTANGVPVLYTDPTGPSVDIVWAAGAPASGTTPQSSSETGTLSGTDAEATVAAAASSSETGTTSATHGDSGSATTTGDTGTLSVTDASTPVIAQPSTETGTIGGTDAETTVAATASSSETGTTSATHADTGAALADSADTGTMSGSEQSSLAVTAASAETGTLTGTDDSLAILPQDSAETGTIAGADAATTTAAVASAETGTASGTDADSGSAAATSAETGTVSGTETSGVETAAADSGTVAGTEAATLAASTASIDTGTVTGADASTGVLAVSSSETGTLSGSESSTPVETSGGQSSAETGTFSGTDADSLLAAVAAASAGTLSGTDAVTVAAMAASADAGTVAGSDADSITAGLTIATTATLSVSSASQVFVSAPAGSLHPFRWQPPVIAPLFVTQAAELRASLQIGTPVVTSVFRSGEPGITPELFEQDSEIDMLVITAPAVIEV